MKIVSNGIKNKSLQKLKLKICMIKNKTNFQGFREKLYECVKSVEYSNAV